MFATRYAPWVRRLHWLVALFIAAALVLIEIKGWFPRGAFARDAVKWGHTQFGVAVLLLMLPRLLVRLRHAAPPISPAPSRGQALLARGAHLLLYALALAVPLLGVAMTVAAGKTWNLLGLPLPVLAQPDMALARSIKDIHETAGDVLLWVAVAHAAAALFHHYVQHDDTLLRMLPPRARPRR